VLLVNLTSQWLPSSGDAQSATAMWQGPVVCSEESEVDTHFYTDLTITSTLSAYTQLSLLCLNNQKFKVFIS